MLVEHQTRALKERGLQPHGNIGNMCIGTAESRALPHRLCSGSVLRSVPVQAVQKLPEKTTHLLRLLPWRIVTCLCYNLHLTPADVLFHHFSFGNASCGVFITSDD